MILTRPVVLVIPTIIILNIVFVTLARSVVKEIRLRRIPIAQMMVNAITLSEMGVILREVQLVWRVQPPIISGSV